MSYARIRRRPVHACSASFRLGLTDTRKETGFAGGTWVRSQLTDRGKLPSRVPQSGDWSARRLRRPYSFTLTLGAARHPAYQDDGAYFENQNLTRDVPSKARSWLLVGHGL
jgi:hypothetical protein